jgi:quinoprotein glucose dehydrogenase
MRPHPRRSSLAHIQALITLAAVAAGACGESMATGAATTDVRGGTSEEWPYIGGDAHHTRYTPLDQINPINFQSLQVAWTFENPDVGPMTARSTPVYVNGMLFSVAGERRHVVRIDPLTGQTVWRFVEPETTRSQYSMRAGYGKGIAYAEVDGRGVVYISTPGFFLFALDAETGQPLENWGRPIAATGFPQTGGVDLLEDLTRDWEPWTSRNEPYDAAKGMPLELGYITSSSPPIVVNDVVIVGNSAEQGYHQATAESIPGDMLAYDARTGQHLWTFHMVPRPGEFGHETWQIQPFKFFGEVSSWAPMAADPARGLVYINTNSGTVDFFGGHRPGDNLYGTSLIALDARTGQRRWHYQMVHHDIWNYDTSTAPILMDVTVNGQRIPGVFQVGKQAFLYAFNRETGEPIWPIEERPVPASLVPGEKLSTTQPFPTKPAPFDMQGLSEADLVDFTPELKQKALAAVEDISIGPLFNPPLHANNGLTSASGKPIRGAYWCPGSSGGVNITHPAAADPTTGIIYVMSQKGCSSNVLIPGAESMSDPVVATTGTTITDFSVVGGPSASPGNIDGLPIFKPPYGRVTAIDLNTGEHLWWIPHGDTPQNVLDTLAARGVTNVPNTGRGGGGSLMVTPSMLLMSGMGSDGTPYVYAINKQTGERLGQIELPSNSSYGMMSYMHEGVQYLMVQVPGSSLVAYKLPPS